MGKLVGGAVLLVIAFSLLLAAATVRAQRPGPISNLMRFAGYGVGVLAVLFATGSAMVVIDPGEVGVRHALDRKSTRLNSSHVAISYAVFCLKKKIAR